MSQINPATHNFTAYREDTFAFALLLQDTEGDPIDVNDTFDSLSMRVFLPNREENPALEPELSVSGNQITGVLSAQDTKKLSGRAYWYEVRVTFNGNEETLLNGKLTVKNATDGKGAQAADLNVTVDFTTLEVTVQTGDSAALALQALASLKPPSRVIFVDGQYENLPPYFDNVVDALVYARSLEPEENPVTIKAFTNGEPIGIPAEEDFYDLADEGIFFESDFDVWQRFPFVGGELDTDKLLYDVDLERTLIQINL